MSFSVEKGIVLVRSRYVLYICLGNLAPSFLATLIVSLEVTAPRPPTHSSPTVPNSLSSPGPCLVAH